MAVLLGRIESRPRNARPGDYSTATAWTTSGRVPIMPGGSRPPTPPHPPSAQPHFRPTRLAHCFDSTPEETPCVGRTPHHWDDRERRTSMDLRTIRITPALALFSVAFAAPALASWPNNTND